MKYVCIILSSFFLVSCGKTRQQSAASDGKDSIQTAKPVGELAALSSLTYEQHQGKNLYAAYCVVCHGEQGGADGFNSYNLDPKPHSLADSAYMSALSDAALTQVIAFGGRGVNKSALMPGYQHTLNKNEIFYLVAYLRALAQNTDAR